MNLVQVMDKFENAVGDSARDSIEKIKREFALAQSKAGWDVALNALAAVFVIAEQRRRAIEAQMLAEDLE